MSPAEPGDTGAAVPEAAEVRAPEPPKREREADRPAGPTLPLPAGPTRRQLDPTELLAFEAAMRDPKSGDRPMVSPLPETEPIREPASSAPARAPSSDFDRLTRQAEPAREPASSAITGVRSSDVDRLTRQDERWLVAGDLASLAVIGALAFLNIANFGGLFRGLLALVFVTCIPGWALARAAGLAGGLSGIAVAMLSSLTICAAASTVMVWLNSWHPLVLLAGIGAVSGLLLLWTLPAALVGARLRG